MAQSFAVLFNENRRVIVSEGLSERLCRKSPVLRMLLERNNDARLEIDLRDGLLYCATGSKASIKLLCCEMSHQVVSQNDVIASLGLANYLSYPRNVMARISKRLSSLPIDERHEASNVFHGLVAIIGILGVPTVFDRLGCAECLLTSAAHTTEFDGRSLNVLYDVLFRAPDAPGGRHVLSILMYVSACRDNHDVLEVASSWFKTRCSTERQMDALLTSVSALASSDADALSIIECFGSPLRKTRDLVQDERIKSIFVKGYVRTMGNFVHLESVDPNVATDVTTGAAAHASLKAVLKKTKVPMSKACFGRNFVMLMEHHVDDVFDHVLPKMDEDDLSDRFGLEILTRLADETTPRLDTNTRVKCMRFLFFSDWFHASITNDKKMSDVCQDLVSRSALTAPWKKKLSWEMKRAPPFIISLSEIYDKRLFTLS